MRPPGWFFVALVVGMVIWTIALLSYERTDDYFGWGPAFLVVQLSYLATVFDGPAGAPMSRTRDRIVYACMGGLFGLVGAIALVLPLVFLAMYAGILVLILAGFVGPVGGVILAVLRARKRTRSRAVSTSLLWLTATFLVATVSFIVLWRLRIDDIAVLCLPWSFVAPLWFAWFLARARASAA